MSQQGTDKYTQQIQHACNNTIYMFLRTNMTLQRYEKTFKCGIGLV